MATTYRFTDWNLVDPIYAKYGTTINLIIHQGTFVGFEFKTGATVNDVGVESVGGGYFSNLETVNHAIEMAVRSETPGYKFTNARVGELMGHLYYWLLLTNFAPGPPKDNLTLVQSLLPKLKALTKESD